MICFPNETISIDVSYRYMYIYPSSTDTNSACIYSHSYAFFYRRENVTKEIRTENCVLNQMYVVPEYTESSNRWKAS